MDNLPRAIAIAASTLLAVIVMAVAIFAIRHVGVLSTQQDENEKTEQLKDFNMEYEAYNKKIMYGVDVLSCLNKARSNNEKYVKGSLNNFLIGEAYPREYIIDIAFKLNSILEDRITVNFLSATNVTVGGVTTSKIAVKETPYIDRGPETKDDGYGGTFQGKTQPASFERVFSKICQGKYLTKVVGAPGENMVSDDIRKSDLIKSTLIESKFFKRKCTWTSDEYYHLLDDLDGAHVENGEIKFSNPQKDYFTNPKTRDEITELLNAATYIKVNVKHTLTPEENREENATLKFMAWDNNDDHNAGWSSAEWKTELYDFKTRKFKCESMTYSSVTGRVISMVFAEI